MKIHPAILLGLLLAACGGQSDSKNEPAQNSNAAPKPVFKVKYIDETAIQGLALGQPAEGKTGEGKKQVSYPIEGLSEQNLVQLTGNHTNDLEVISGKCMETGDKGRSTGWSEGGTCHTLFAKLVDNVAQDSGKLTAYLLSHAALQPYQAGKSGYAAVQNGRYILEIDSEGMFYFRRRHY